MTRDNREAPSVTSRKFVRRSLFGWRKAWHRALVAVILLQVWSMAPASRADDAGLRLRVEWGGASERRWQGTLSAEQATLSEPRPLGIEADEPGSMWAADGRILIRSRSPRAYDGMDVTLSAASASK